MGAVRSVPGPETAAPKDAHIRSLLFTDPTWAAYAIADLQPDFAPYCRWHVADRASGAGLIMLFTRLSPPALFAMGDVEAVADAMVEADLPDRVYMTLRPEHHTVAARLYDFSADRRPMWRMKMADVAAVPSNNHPPNRVQVQPLRAKDAARIRRLYAHGGDFAPDAFDEYQAADSTFFGVAGEDSELLAVGGTHIVDWKAGIAAIGNMYTHPAHRGKGFGSAVLRAIVDRLLNGGATTIVLNVDERNTAARGIYEKHGFEAYCPYWEGLGIRRIDGA